MESDKRRERGRGEENEVEREREREREEERVGKKSLQLKLLGDRWTLELGSPTPLGNGFGTSVVLVVPLPGLWVVSCGCCGSLGLVSWVLLLHGHILAKNRPNKPEQN